MPPHKQHNGDSPPPLQTPSLQAKKKSPLLYKPTMFLRAHLFLLPTLTLTLALVAPAPRHPPSPHLHGSSCKLTTTVTKTVTVTVPIYAPTGNISVPFPNTTVASMSTSVDLAPVTLITLSTEAATATGGGLEPITLITLPTATATSGGDGGDAGAAPTPNDIAPITLIDISTAVPI
ncbi:hypothetical protein COCSADRAFT_218024 [Bipolaris sorokiniana ND90Pr]|uniref:Uncharacterized protein n=2 Tax=Cochliobolus sativus TaxID=45130 RepID=M2SSK2_COCSN|nr:uncharacterized protein COCSADRAFT_218024 [Bipolaris sorokiniana ND90Pr]EMD70183.1 hypothetical protein COCSADRAFT_218024 [Bipolaris sorokiniana ND90Pr]